jgi:hypothetical protein
VFEETGDTGIGPDTQQGGAEDKPLGGQGGEGAEKERATPPLTDDAVPGQTQHDAPADDAGGPREGED